MAEDYYEKCYKLLRENPKLGEQHPLTLSCMNNLALLYYRLKRITASEAMYQKCYQQRVAAVGETHVDSLVALYNLALFYSSERQNEVAKKHMSLCYERRKAVLGEEHLDTRQTLKKLREIEGVC